jgi:DNA gyrase/topoisomerase IV subunit B
VHFTYSYVYYITMHCDTVMYVYCDILYYRLSSRMDELAYLNAGVKLIMTDLREGLNDDGTPKKSKEYLHEVCTIYSN